MINQNRFYVDIHVIQAVPPSCMNRDDTGSPKTAYIGGVNRARVSSQSWKHEMRREFKFLVDEDMLAKRTKCADQMIADYIMEKASGITREDAETLARKVFLDALEACKGAKEKKSKAPKGASDKEKKAKKLPDVLFFLGVKEAKKLADIALKMGKEKIKNEELVDALKNTPSVETVLFGRMVADVPSLNYDAASQVANAFSTHEVHNEFDYFTAVDDIESTNGAAHIGTMEFNASTLYRYATVNVMELKEHLKEVTPQVVSSFVSAFVLSMPGGKQNTFANRTFPDFVYVTIRRDQNASMSGAFEKPVRAKGDGYVEPSIKQFVAYANKMYKWYATKPQQAFVLGEGVDGLEAQSFSLPELLGKLEAAVKEVL